MVGSYLFNWHVIEGTANFCFYAAIHATSDFQKFSKAFSE